MVGLVDGTFAERCRQSLRVLTQDRHEIGCIIVFNAPFAVRHRLHVRFLRTVVYLVQEE